MAKQETQLEPRWAQAHLDDIVPYEPGKPPELLARERGIANAVKLSANENPLGPSPAAIAAVRAVASNVHRYPDDQAYNLRARLARMLGVEPTELMFGHGSNELIDLLTRTIVGPTDHAICGVPSFASYALSLRAAHVPFTEVPLRGRLFWDLDAVLAAVRPETRLIFIDNPNNPTSTHVPATTLRAFLRDVPKAVTVVVDEAYIDFAEASDYVSSLTLRDLRERLVVVRTFSKAHALAALRVGYAVAPAPLVGYVNRARLPFNANAVGQAAALASLDDTAHLAECVRANRQERARMIAALRDLGVAPAPSQTNFVTVPFGASAGPVYDGLLDAGLIVRQLGPPIADCLRISIGSVAENDRLLAALSKLV